MGLRTKINGAVAGVATKLGIAWALGQVRAAAEGRLGPEWKARYWALAGKKTVTGVIFAVAAIIAFIFELPTAAEWIGTLAGVAVSAGVLDKAWRTERPLWLTRNPAYVFLAAHSGLLTLLFSSAFALVQTGYCAGIDCAIATPILLTLAAIATWAGLLDAAWKAAPPILRRHDGRWELQIPDDLFPGFPHVKIVADSPEEVRETWAARQASDGRAT